MADELIDVLDEHGQRTGQTKLKSEVHRDGDWHLSARVWLVNSRGDLLLQQRSMSMDTNPGRWDTSCVGHVAAGEEVVETAVRELREELGIQVAASDLVFAFRVSHEFVPEGATNTIREFSDVFLLNSDITRNEIKLDPSEVTDVAWVPYLDLEQRVRAGDQSIISHPDEYQNLFQVLHKRFPHKT